jgi:hypothetical protein
MSFDIFLQSVHNRGEPRQMTNPFTGEPATIFPQGGLEPHERDAVCGVIASYRLPGPDEFGCYLIGLPDGGSAELFASNLADHHESCDGMMVACRNLTPKLAHFIFDLMDRGNMAALPAMEDTRTFVTSEHWSDFTPGDGAPPTVVVRSPAELHAALTGGYEGWQRYRDQVIG